MEQRVDHCGTGALEVRPVRRAPGLRLLGREHGFGHVQRVDADDADEAPGKMRGGVERHRASEGIADEHDIPQIQRLGDGAHIAGERRNRPALPVPA